jgi:3-hydroxyisobutyrate dehydrogenase-like beta-hydroxyacid dehydrogenase
MKSRTIGILHPGEMGASIAAAAKLSGHAVYWVSEGRSAQSQARAEEQGLLDAHTLAELCATCSILISVCPPYAAEDLAGQVMGHNFQGLYLDANAIAPQRALRIGQTLEAKGANFVDGGIIGGPAWEPGKTLLHLSGDCAEVVAACFSASPLVTNILGPEPGKASALKMCYAAYTKGTTALLCAILATAETLDVREALCEQWSKGNSNLDQKAVEQVRSVTAKAWRFEGEMREISSTFEDAGIPGGFHAAAATLYKRIAGFKDAPETPSLESVLAMLKQAGTAEQSIATTQA